MHKTNIQIPKRSDCVHKNRKIMIEDKQNKQYYLFFFRLQDVGTQSIVEFEKFLRKFAAIFVLFLKKKIKKKKTTTKTQSALLAYEYFRVAHQFLDGIIGIVTINKQYALHQMRQ